MPVPDYDNLLVGQYIRAIENPDSIGFKNGMWFQSPRKVDDPNNRGFGVDVKHNKKVAELVKDREGKWLSEEEERNLRNQHIDYSQSVLDKWTPKTLANYPSAQKQAMATGMLYRGDGIKAIINNPKLRDAYYSGTNEEFLQAVDEYYKSKELPERAHNHTEFMESHPEESILTTDWQESQFKPTFSFGSGGRIQSKSAWDSLSLQEKAHIIKLAVQSNITNLKDIKDYYNEFAEGGNKKPVTTGGAGYIPSVPDPSFVVNKVRERLYDTVNPLTDYNIPKNTDAFLSGEKIDYGDIKKDKDGKAYIDYEDGITDVEVADDIWAKYLNIPENRRRFKTRIQQSDYKPQMGGKENLAYYKLPLTDDEKEWLIEETNNLPVGKNKVTDIFSGYNLADHTVGRGMDDKGEYRSYYDRWDINPFNGKYQGWNIPFLNSLPDTTMGIGKPVEIYDRLYLDDYYGAPEPTHSTYIPEVTIYSSKYKSPFQELMEDTGKINSHAEGGSIHIKPENRGKFTALKKRTGHSASWFKEHGTPAQKKMATFALNARKWKHGLGGNLFDGVNNNTNQMQIGQPYFDYNLPDHPLTVNAFLPEVSIIPDSRKSPAQRNEDNRFRQRSLRDYAENSSREWTEKQVIQAQREWENSPQKKALDFGIAAAQGLGMASDVTSSLFGGIPVYSGLKGAQALDRATQTGDVADYIESGLWLTPVVGIAGKEVINTAKPVVEDIFHHPALQQYPRYVIGKFKYGFDVELPTLYRKVKTLPKIEDRKVVVSNPNNRFAFENGFGEESPILTNFTTDAPVRSHSAGDWDRGLTLAFPGKTLLGKNVVSTRPSDTFTFGDYITVPARKVTGFSGRPKELTFLESNGIKAVSSPEAEVFWESGASDMIDKVAQARATNAKIFSRKGQGITLLKPKTPVDNFGNYANTIEGLVKDNFKNPTERDYQFMDYVFRPRYTSRVIPKVENINMDAVTQYPELGEWIGNFERRRYLEDVSRWTNVLYDPMTSAEADFRKEMNIGLKPKYKK